MQKEVRNKMKTLSFYDLKSKKKFMTDKYKITVRKGRQFAVANAPSGIESWRVLGMAPGAKKKTPAKKKRK